VIFDEGNLVRSHAPGVSPSAPAVVRQWAHGWKTPRTRSAEKAFASSFRFGGPTRRAHESVPPGLSGSQVCGDCNRFTTEGSVRGSRKGQRISVEPSASTSSSAEADADERHEVFARKPGRGKSSRARTDVFESVGERQLSHPWAGTVRLAAAERSGHPSVTVRRPHGVRASEVALRHPHHCRSRQAACGPRHSGE
jgi:hypothetical protein